MVRDEVTDSGKEIRVGVTRGTSSPSWNLRDSPGVRWAEVRTRRRGPRPSNLFKKEEAPDQKGVGFFLLQSRLLEFPWSSRSSLGRY